MRSLPSWGLTARQGAYRNIDLGEKKIFFFRLSPWRSAGSDGFGGSAGSDGWRRGAPARVVRVAEVKGGKGTAKGRIFLEKIFFSRLPALLHITLDPPGLRNDLDHALPAELRSRNLSPCRPHREGSSVS
jgi:hypothetical protein